MFDALVCSFSLPLRSGQSSWKCKKSRKRKPPGLLEEHRGKYGQPRYQMTLARGVNDVAKCATNYLHIHYICTIIMIVPAASVFLLSNARRYKTVQPADSTPKGGNNQLTTHVDPTTRSSLFTHSRTWSSSSERVPELSITMSAYATLEVMGN